MRLVFAGTPAFAAASLEAVLQAGHEVALVLTQPDRPAGRGLKMQASAVKLLAAAHGLPVLQPRSLRREGRYPEDAEGALQALTAVRPQAVAVVAYGLMLPRWMLDLPPMGCLNVHASLLPRWRGAAPIQRAIEAGDALTGVCIMRMEEGLDTGPVLLRETESILHDDTAGSLQDRLAALGARLLVQALSRLAAAPWPTEAQPEEGACYARKIDKSEAPIDWRRPAAEIERRLRAFDPFPGCSFVWQGEAIKLWRAALRPPQVGHPVPGQVLVADGQRLWVTCGDGGVLALRIVQRPGGRRAEVGTFLAGLGAAAPRAGDRLG